MGKVWKLGAKLLNFSNEELALTNDQIEDFKEFKKNLIVRLKNDNLKTAKTLYNGSNTFKPDNNIFKMMLKGTFSNIEEKKNKTLKTENIANIFYDCRAFYYICTLTLIKSGVLNDENKRLLLSGDFSTFKSVLEAVSNFHHIYSRLLKKYYKRISVFNDNTTEGAVKSEVFSNVFSRAELLEILSISNFSKSSKNDTQPSNIFIDYIEYFYHSTPTGDYFTHIATSFFRISDDYSQEILNGYDLPEVFTPILLDWMKNNFNDALQLHSKAKNFYNSYYVPKEYALDDVKSFINFFNLVIPYYFLHDCSRGNARIVCEQLFKYNLNKYNNYNKNYNPQEHKKHEEFVSKLRYRYLYSLMNAREFEKTGENIPFDWHIELNCP